jgi:hypothetical protein
MKCLKFTNDWKCRTQTSLHFKFQKTFEDLQKVLKRLRSTLNDNEKEKKFVYMLSGVLCGLIVPAEVEEAVRLGELESVSLSRSCDKAAFKIR